LLSYRAVERQPLTAEQRPEPRLELRRDRRTGSGVWVVGDRQQRPNLPSTSCPFCPGGLEAPEPYDVRWFPNRWPPLEGERCEVLLFCPEHDGSLAALGRQRVRRVVDLWAARTEAQGRRADVAYVLIFENRGPEVGATIAHPHGQLYALADVPPAAAGALAGDACPVCAELARGHAVSRIEGWSIVVPHAATWPYELLIAPDAHLPDLPVLDDTARDGLAAALVDGLGRLDRLFDRPMPYMAWIHQRPTDGADWPLAHVRVEVAPLWRAAGVPRFVAAGELGSGLYFNPVLPEEAAAALRSC
jgi:UDPglucose--hexose-1-phosphate uridylyltransferase